jgi:integrase
MARSKNTMFTDTMIKKLKPEEMDYIRSEGNGFSVCVRPTGSKTWLYLYAIDGKRRKMNLGQYPDVTLETARGKFEDAKKQVKNGVDPLAVKEEIQDTRRKTPTMSELVTDYIQYQKDEGKKAWREVERVLLRDVVPKWKNKKITDLERDDMVRLVRDIAKRAPVQANRVLAYTRSMMSWAVDHTTLKANPFTGSWKRVIKKEDPKHRCLADSEIAIFWGGLDRCPMSEPMKRILKLILVTGQRPGEVAGMHSSEIDESGKWWIIPASRMKNNRPHAVYLTKTARELIGEATGYFFPNPRDNSRPFHVNALSHATRRSFDVLGIEPYSPHDLRRTMNTIMTGCKIIKEYRERVLSHTLERLDGTYNVYEYSDEKQMAVEAVERKLLSIISGTESNVIPINRKKAA